MSALQCIVVSPEKTELDVRVEAVVVPLFDGEFGILKDHSPLIGRLGYGSLKLRQEGGSEQQYYVDAGFIQVADNVVSILTDRLLPISALKEADATKLLEQANSLPAKTVEARAIKEKAISQARAQLKIVGSSSSKQ